VEDQPEHREANATEQREKESAVDPPHERVGWAPGTCLGYTRRAPDRLCTKRPDTAPANFPPSRLASYSSRIAPALLWVGVLGSGIDTRTVPVSKYDGTGLPRAVEVVGRTAFQSEDLIDPASLQSVGIRSSLHGISFGGVKGSALLTGWLRRKFRWIRAGTGQLHDQFGSIWGQSARSARVQPFGSRSQPCETAGCSRLLDAGVSGRVPGSGILPAENDPATVVARVDSTRSMNAGR